MTYAFQIFALAAMTTFAFVFAAMAIRGIVRRRIQWEPDTRPTHLSEMPVRFVLQMLYLLVLLTLSVTGDIKVLRELVD